MLYPVHIAASRHDPLPPVAELSTIEADSPQEALELLKREPLAMSGARFKPFGCALSSALWPNGNAHHVLSTEVSVQRLTR